jgi:hypothetical protein
MLRVEHDLGMERERRRAAMERHPGADVHAASVTFSVLDASDQLRRHVVATNGTAVVGYLQQLVGNLHLCVKEGEWSQWLTRCAIVHAPSAGGAQQIVSSRPLG